MTTDPKRILVIRLDSLGDGVLSLPAINSLQKQFPKAQIDFLVSRPLFDLYPLFFFPRSNITLFEPNWLTGKSSLRDFFDRAARLRASRYDLAIDFRGDIRSILLMSVAGIPQRWGRTGTGGGFLLSRSRPVHFDRHEVLECLDLVHEKGRSTAAEFPAIRLNPEAHQKFQEKLVNFKGQRKIVIHVGAGYPSKRWPVSNFLALAKRIREKGLGVPIFVGGENEKHLVQSFSLDLQRGFLDLVGKTTLAELLYLLSLSDLFIGDDSGPAHLAAALKKKLVVVFSGTNDPAKWAPWSPDLRLVRYPVPCSPCEEKVCPKERHFCMEDIKVEQVFEAVKEDLGA